MNPVLCVRNDPDDTLGITPLAFESLRLPVECFDAFSTDVRWPGVEEISALVIFGGEMNADETERHPYLLTQRALMRRAVDAELPVLGICLGAQMLARALDARVYRAPVRELGFKTVRLTAAGQGDTLLSAFQTGDRVFQWHEDTFDLPDGADLLVAGDDVLNQAFRCGRRAWGVQFHFEVEAQEVEAWLRVAEPTLSRAWNRTADEVREELRMYLETQQRRSRVLLSAFADTVRSANP